MISELYVVAITLRQIKTKMTITQGYMDLISKEICEALENEDYHGDFSGETFLQVAGVRT